MRTSIERQKYLVDFTVSSMARRKGKNLALLALYTLIVFLLASVMLFTEALRREATLTLQQTPEVLVQRMMAGRHDLIPASYLEKLQGVRGVQRAEARLWGYYYDPFFKTNFTVMVPPASSDMSIATGRAAVGRGVARRLHLSVGDPIVLTSYSGKIAAMIVARVFDHASELLSSDLVLVSEEDFRSFFAYPGGHYTDIALTVANPREVGTIAAKVADRLPDTRVILRDEILRTYESIFNWREGIVLVLLAGAILAFGIFVLDKASGLSANEKREIGILKAIGWETGDILRMKLWEGALISLSAFLLGYALAYLHVFRFGSALFRPVLMGWSTLYPRFELTPVVDGFQLATLFFFTVFPYALATVVPAWRAAVTDPDLVMRGVE